MPPTPADPQQFLIQYLAGRDVECPLCRYNLRDQQRDVCPECGESVALGLHMVEPKQAAPLTGLIGLSAGAGLNGLLLIYMVAMLLLVHNFDTSDTRNFLWGNGPSLLVLCIFILVWLRGWRWIRRRRAGIRWTLAGLCWVATLIDLAIFTSIIR
jgi:hypothetical protein